MNQYASNNKGISGKNMIAQYNNSKASDVLLK
jgi:hypothetical protein